MKKLLTSIFLLMSIIVHCQIVTNGLKAHFEFNGTLQDATAHNHDLMLSSGTLNYTVNPNGDSVLVLDGNTKLHTIGSFDNSTFTETSISLWFKSSTITNDIQIIFQGVHIGFGVYIAPNTGKIMGFFDGSSVGAYESSMVLTDNNWHHIIIHSDGGLTSMYVDGQLDGILQEPMMTGTGGSSNQFYIGRSNFNIMPFTGQLNDVRVYNRVLTNSEIKTLYTSGGVSFNQNTLILYPNPTDDLLNIKPESAYDYEIFSANGAKVLAGNSSKIDVSRLGAGTYFIRINGVLTKSFIKR